MKKLFLSLAFVLVSSLSFASNGEVRETVENVELNSETTILRNDFPVHVEYSCCYEDIYWGGSISDLQNYTDFMELVYCP